MNLKIAAIVLVVIVAVLILLNIPYWLYEVAKHRQERAIFALTPELVISRCGMPLSDVTQEYPGTPGANIVFRELSYSGGNGNPCADLRPPGPRTTAGKMGIQRDGEPC